MTNCRPAGTAPSPTIQRQPPRMFSNAAPMPYATTWPPVIITTLSTTMRPRRRVGDSSWMYSGAMHDARPTPMPMRKRHPIWGAGHLRRGWRGRGWVRTMDQTVWQTACPMAPPMKMTSEIASTGFRPT